MAEPDRSLDLQLTVLPPGAEVSPGAPVTALAGARASLQLGASSAVLEISLPDRSLAEQRWVVDKVLRSLGGVVRTGVVELRGAESVPDDALLALGLDLHHRTAARVRVRERSAVAARVRAIGAREDEFRAWVNEDAADRTSVAIARDVEAWAAEQPEVEAEVLDEVALREHGLRLLLAVGGGSAISPPRLVLAHYRPAGATADPLLLLGKGVTFDTGGINVKPYESYVPMMKNDMAGAALAFAVFRALVETGHDRPLALALPTCENAVDANSMRPGAVIQSYRGPRVRVDHTDAEGRLILADGLAYAVDRYQPRQVLSFATLTTAALISYGPYATPVHFADDELERRLRDASVGCGEDLHFFPERIWHYEANRDLEADLRNTARLPGDASRAAGSRNAAHFLKHFCDVGLCHFDIFASTWNWAGDAPGAGYGATGAPLRTLLRAFGADR